jgi:hypothetical protein
MRHNSPEAEPMHINCCHYQWDLQEDVCPCDVHFNDWVRAQDLRDKVIYHFGTGSHHVVGAEQATNGSANTVLAITASAGEHEAYVKLVSERAEIARRYVVYFGDIYLTNPRLLPRFDVVTMFHLCEFSWPATPDSGYDGLSDGRLLDLFTGALRRGGHMLFYTGSMAWPRTRDLLPAWESGHPVERVGEHKTLLVYRKTAEG